MSTGRYPDEPGFTEPTTSKDAAMAIAPRVKNLRERVFDAIADAGPGGISADDVAARLKLSVLTVRPRVSELRLAERIEETGERRVNQSGMTAHKWRIIPQQQELGL